MNDTRTSGWAVVGGALGSVLVITALVVRSFPAGPGAEATIKTHAAWLTDYARTTRLSVAWALAAVGGVLVLWALAGLYARLSSGNGTKTVGRFFFAVGIGYAVFLLASFSAEEAIPAAFYFDAFTINEVTAQTGLFFEGLTYVFTYQASLFGVAMVIAGSVAATRTRIAPQWVAWVGYLLAVFGVLGFVVESAAAAAAAVWLLVVSVVALPGRHNLTAAP